MAVIEVKNFQKAFGGRIIHKNVSFDVKKGECLGLVGGSGMGKSVILRSLIGLEKPDSGEIWIEGEEIAGRREKDLVEIRKKVSYVFQNGALFDSMSVYNNLAYPLREHTNMSEAEIKDRIQDTLAEFGLAGSEQKSPAQLSGGMQKRVGMARAIIMGPRVVLYDEPTAGLDPFNTIKIQEMILQMKAKGVTSIFVTHDMPSVYACCDRIALLYHGEIKEVGTLNDLKKNPESLLNKFMSGEEM